MRYAIFSDIHSNLEALKSVLAAYAKESIDKYLCVGDIVGYGADPSECIKIIRDKNIPTVAGNHDWASSGKFSIEFFNPHARSAVLWTRAHLNIHEVEYLNSLDLFYRECDFCLVHGTLLKPGHFEYLFELSDAKESFEVMQEPICFIGHTHLPLIFERDGEEIAHTKEEEIVVESNKQYIVNVGSVGQPRDGDSRACFCIYDSKQRTIQIKRTDYNIKSAQLKILNSGMPSALAHRLVLGQ